MKTDTPLSPKRVVCAAMDLESMIIIALAWIIEVIAIKAAREVGIEP